MAVQKGSTFGPLLALLWLLSVFLIRIVMFRLGCPSITSTILGVIVFMVMVVRFVLVVVIMGVIAIHYVGRHEVMADS